MALDIVETQGKLRDAIGALADQALEQATTLTTVSLEAARAAQALADAHTALGQAGATAS